MITPQSEIILLNAPLSADQKNQIDFADAAAQYAYFFNRALFTYADLTYIPKDSAVDVPKNIDALWSVNYCMYKNDELPNKYFYAFVTKIEYRSEDVTRLYLSTDVYQTWLFNFTVKSSFVEREHETEVE